MLDSFVYYFWLYSISVDVVLLWWLFKTGLTARKIETIRAHLYETKDIFPGFDGHGA